MDEIIFYVGFILGQMSRTNILSELDEKLREQLLDYVNNKGFHLPYRVEGERK